MKKLSLIALCGAAAMFSACGDDDSSSASNVPAKDAEGRTVYTDMQSALEAPCTEANQCEVIILNDPIVQDTMICIGTAFQSVLGKTFAQCAATPASSSDAAAPASSDAAVAGSSSDAAAAPASSAEAATTEAGPTGALVSCDFVAEGVLGEHSCVEAVASDVVVPTFCQTMGAMGEGMTATTGTGCNAPETALKCVKNGMNFYSLDGKASCDEFFQASVLQGLAASL